MDDRFIPKIIDWARCPNQKCRGVLKATVPQHHYIYCGDCGFREKTGKFKTMNKNL